jgi:hypothetical protein
MYLSARLYTWNLKQNSINSISIKSISNSKMSVSFW